MSEEILRKLLSASEHMLEAIGHLNIPPQPIRVADALAAARADLLHARRLHADVLCLMLEAEGQAKAAAPRLEDERVYAAGLRGHPGYQGFTDEQLFDIAKQQFAKARRAAKDLGLTI
jgi:hypothetical protein